MRPLGRTGLSVFPVGLGAGALGDPSLGEAEAERLLLGALDLGVNLIDTAPSYGLSEERIGRILGARRAQVVLSTKGGYGVPGAETTVGRNGVTFGPRFGVVRRVSFVPLVPT